MVAGEQHLGHLPAPVERAAGCSGGTPASPPAPRLKDSSTALSAWPSAPGNFRINDVGDHHRRQLSPGQHVAPDRDLVVGQVLVHPLVEALVAPTEQRPRAALRSAHRRAHRPAAARSARAGRPAASPAPIGGPQGRVDHIDPRAPSRPPPVGRVVDLPGPKRRRIAVVEAAAARCPRASAFWTERCD